MDGEYIDYSYFDNILALIELHDLERRCGLPLTKAEDYKPYGNGGEELRYNPYHDPKTGRFTSGKSLDNSGEYDIIKTRGDNVLKVNTGGRRNETSLSEKEITEVKNYAVSLGMPEGRIYYVDYDCTGYGCSFDLLRIGTDVYPSSDKQKNPNSNISMHGAIAHEIIGHRQAALYGHTQENEVLEEAQASIRAAKFTPSLTPSERITLYRDAVTRLKNNGIKLKDVKQKLYIFKR